MSANPGRLIALAFLLSAGSVAGALALQHVWGYQPCQMCLWQRIPHYAGLPLLAVAWAFRGRLRVLSPVAAYAAAGILAGGAVLAAYHAGVEWGFWEGPSGCGATALGKVTDAAALLDAIRDVRPVSCTEAALRVGGLSLAGWNALASAAAAALAAAGAGTVSLPSGSR